MSGNSYLSYYSYCNPCKQNYCQIQYNPCQIQCNPCQSQCVPSPCPIYPPISPCPAVTYITSSSTITSIPTGTVGVAPTPIPIGSTTIPVNTVTSITGLTGVPTINIGGITVNATTGQLTVPIAGRYDISAYVSFMANAIGTREIYIYKVDVTTGIISLLASDSRNATIVGSTNATISTTAQLNSGDRIFYAVTQNSGTVIITTTDSRFTITRLC